MRHRQEVSNPYSVPALTRALSEAKNAGLVVCSAYISTKDAVVGLVVTEKTGEEITVEFPVRQYARGGEYVRRALVCAVPVPA